MVWAVMLVDWKRARLECTPETYDHIKKPGVRWFEIGEVFNHEFIPRKVRVENEIQYAVLGESFGRMSNWSKVMWSLYVPQHRSTACGRFAKRDVGYWFDCLDCRYQ